MAFVAVIPILYMPKEFFEGSVVVSESIQKVVYSDVSELLKNSFFNATMLSLKVIVLITVIIFLMAYLKSTKMMQKYQEKVNTSFSIMAGLILGITYGAGILIHEVKSGSLSKVDIFYIATFLMICHSVIEDVLLFVIFGANGWAVIMIRLIMAFVFSYILLKIYAMIIDTKKEGKENVSK